MFVSQASSATNKAVGKKCTKIIEMECDCGCGRRNIIDDKFELEKLINSLTYQKGKGKTVARLYITKRNQRGETEARREIAVPHPIEVLEKEMAKYYTQSFPLEVQKLVRSFLETLHSC